MTLVSEGGLPLHRRNRRVLLAALMLVPIMTGASFAAVPLYDLFCRVTGFAGTTQVADIAPSPALVDREVRVRFTADAHSDLPWRFTADQREVTVRLGEQAIIYYTAENVSDRPVAGTAVYNVNPNRAGAYFFKVRCFCFQEQILMPGQTAQFPVYFYVDASLDEDDGNDNIRTITLSYTFFPTESEALERARTAYYAAASAANGAAEAD